MRAYLLAHELEHGNQEDIDKITEKWKDSNSYAEIAQGRYLNELDADISAKQTLEDLIPKGELTKYMQVMDLNYLYAYMHDLKNVNNPGMHVTGSDHHTLPQMNDYFEQGALHGEVADINLASNELAKNIMLHMGASNTEPEHISQIFKITDTPSMGQIKTALQEMISDETNPLPEDQAKLASTFLESMDNLGIAGQDYSPVTEANSKIVSDSKKLFESFIKKPPEPVAQP